MAGDFSPQGPDERIVELTEQAIALADDPETYAEAERLLAEALDLAPDNADVKRNYVGFCGQVAGNSLAQGDNGAAILYFGRALEYAPEDAEAWLDVGTAYANSGMALEALQAWQKALVFLDARDPTQRENIEAIAENIVIIARAMEKTINVTAESESLRKAAARLIVALQTSSKE